MEAETARNMDGLEDAIRKSMKGLGFNIFIYPEGQDMAEVYSQGFASKTMPEEYVTTLANSEIVTVNHLLPRLTRKIKWPEQDRTVVLIGVRGEVPLAHKDPKKPLIEPVPAGDCCWLRIAQEPRSKNWRFYSHLWKEIFSSQRTL